MSRSRTPGWTFRSISASTRTTCAPPRSTTCSATPPRPTRPLVGGPRTGFHELVRLMLESDLAEAGLEPARYLRAQEAAA